MIRLAKAQSLAIAALVRGHRRDRWTGWSTCRQRNAHSSPRRAPLTIVSQTNIPQSGSTRNDSAIKRAASSGVGGCGSGDGTGGGSAWSIGLTPTHRQRTARL